MKRYFSIGIVVVSFLLALSGSVNALTINGNIDVGALDPLLAKKDLGNAGDTDVTTWINEVLVSEGFGSGYK
jgi:hypothetical protein